MDMQKLAKHVLSLFFLYRDVFKFDEGEAVKKTLDEVNQWPGSDFEAEGGDLE